MDLRSALSAVIDQIKTKPTVTSQKKKTFSKKRKHKASANKTEKKEESSPEHLSNSTEYATDEEAAVKKSIVSKLDGSKVAYKELLEIQEFFNNSKAKLEDSDNFSEEAISLIHQIEDFLKKVTSVAGIRAHIKRALTECNCLVEGLESEDVSFEEFYIKTLDEAVDRAKNLIRIYDKKDRDISDLEEGAENISSMFKNKSFKRLSELNITDENHRQLVTGASILPLGSFSAKLLSKFFNADASSGYPVLPDQIIYVFNTSLDKLDEIDFEKELDKFATETVKYGFVSKQPKFYGNYLIYWVMTYRQLDQLKRSAAYQDYMMIRDWDYL